MERLIINGVNFVSREKTASTNDLAKEEKSPEHLLTFIADEQSAGKGRVGRKFESPFGGLYMSVILLPQKCACTPSFCTPCAALALIDVLSGVSDKKFYIKWVNDIITSQKKKVSGILTEGVSRGSGLSFIVVGIGVNLLPLSKDIPDEVKKCADSINYCGDKLLLACEIVKRLEYYISLDKSEILRRYRERLYYIGKEILYTDYSGSGDKSRGIMLGVDDNCSLIVKKENGDIKTVFSGEMS